MKIKEKNIKDVIVGDLILCSDNIIRTVSANKIKQCAFMGISIFGDSYALGYKPVKVVENYSSNKSFDL
jgi:predicted PP-loop superfamily ATPase